MPLRLYNNDDRRLWDANSRPDIRQHYLPGRHTQAVTGQCFPSFHQGFHQAHTMNRYGNGYNDVVVENGWPQGVRDIVRPPYTRMDRGNEYLDRPYRATREPMRLDDACTDRSSFNTVYRDRTGRRRMFREMRDRVYELDPICAGGRNGARGMLDRLNRGGWLHGRRRSF
jgi:hypothetical protein